MSIGPSENGEQPGCCSACGRRRRTLTHGDGGWLGSLAAAHCQVSAEQAAAVMDGHALR